MTAKLGNGVNGALHTGETTYTNGYRPSSPSSPQQKKVETKLYTARERQVADILETALIPSTENCFQAYLCEVQGSFSAETTKNTLDRIVSIYKDIFSSTVGLNTSTIRHPQYIEETDPVAISQAFKRAERVFQKYKESYIEEAIPTLPKKIIANLNLQVSDLEFVKYVFEACLPILREQNCFEPQFCVETTRGFIHYVLGVPSNQPKSNASRIVLELKDLHLID